MKEDLPHKYGWRGPVDSWVAVMMMVRSDDDDAFSSLHPLLPLCHPLLPFCFAVQRALHSIIYGIWHGMMKINGRSVCHTEDGELSPAGIREEAHVVNQVHAPANILFPYLNPISIMESRRLL